MVDPNSATQIQTPSMFKKRDKNPIIYTWNNVPKKSNPYKYFYYSVSTQKCYRSNRSNRHISGMKY